MGEGRKDKGSRKRNTSDTNARKRTESQSPTPTGDDGCDQQTHKNNGDNEESSRKELTGRTGKQLIYQKAARTKELSKATRMNAREVLRSDRRSLHYL